LQAALDYTKNEWLIANLVGEAKTRLRGVKWRWPTLPRAILLTNRIGGHGPASVARRCRSEHPVLRQTCAPGAAAVTASLTTIMPGFDSRCRHLGNTWRQPQLTSGGNQPDRTRRWTWYPFCSRQLS